MKKLTLWIVAALFTVSAAAQGFNIQGQLLIANHIEFYEPETNELLSFSVPLTQEFQEILSKLPRF